MGLTSQDNEFIATEDESLLLASKKKRRSNTGQTYRSSKQGAALAGAPERASCRQSTPASEVVAERLSSILLVGFSMDVQGQPCLHHPRSHGDTIGFGTSRALVIFLSNVGQVAPIAAQEGSREGAFCGICWSRYKWTQTTRGDGKPVLQV